MHNNLINVRSIHDLREKPLSILIVEDSAIERAFLERRVADMGHSFLSAENGRDALNILQSGNNAIDMVLMDRMMPVMDGLTAVKAMKDDPQMRRIPVIMVTAADSPKDMEEGLEAGVFYYLTKPVNEEILHSVLGAASREVRQNDALDEELLRHQTSFGLIHTARFELRSLEEAEALAAFMAHCFPDPQRVLVGLADLLINAVEHGNLEIGYDRKGELLAAGVWRAEVERRLKLPEYKDRIVEALLTRKDNGIYAIISDQGKGFDWKAYMVIDPARASHNHGRGIAQAKAVSFDHMTFNEAGNRVVAFVGEGQALEW